ncbi:hypothetical protein P7C73_g991, partial [Tremellales sp. Uapishka_1]
MFTALSPMHPSDRLSHSGPRRPISYDPPIVRNPTLGSSDGRPRAIVHPAPLAPLSPECHPYRSPYRISRRPYSPPPMHPSHVHRPPTPPPPATGEASEGSLPGFQPDYPRKQRKQPRRPPYAKDTKARYFGSGRPPPPEAYLVLQGHKVPRCGWKEIDVDNRSTKDWMYELKIIQQPEKGRAIGLDRLRRVSPGLARNLATATDPTHRQGQERGGGLGRVGAPYHGAANPTLSRKLSQMMVFAELYSADCKQPRGQIRVTPFIASDRYKAGDRIKTLIGNTSIMVNTFTLRKEGAQKAHYFMFHDLVSLASGNREADSSGLAGGEAHWGIHTEAVLGRHVGGLMRAGLTNIAALYLVMEVDGRYIAVADASKPIPDTFIVDNHVSFHLDIHFISHFTSILRVGLTSRLPSAPYSAAPLASPTTGSRVVSRPLEGKDGSERNGGKLESRWGGPIQETRSREGEREVSGEVRGDEHRRKGPKGRRRTAQYRGMGEYNGEEQWERQSLEMWAVFFENLPLPVIPHRRCTTAVTLVQIQYETNPSSRKRTESHEEMPTPIQPPPSAHASPFAQTHVRPYASQTPDRARLRHIGRSVLSFKAGTGQSAYWTDRRQMVKASFPLESSLPQLTLLHLKTLPDYRSKFSLLAPTEISEGGETRRALSKKIQDAEWTNRKLLCDLMFVSYDVFNLTILKEPVQCLAGLLAALISTSKLYDQTWNASVGKG